jgi:two-component system, sensor histidine kinase and response regulator
VTATAAATTPTAADHVLIVDDSPSNRKVAAGHLRAAGYRVSAVESGEEALALLLRTAGAPADDIDLVLLDVLMPGLGGFETCRRIRATPSIASIPVLFLTALGDRGTTQPAIDAGGDDLLPKPFGHAELLLRVRALIRHARQGRQLAAQNEAMRRISQMIVHDLRSPTSAIMANADYLADAQLSGEFGEAVADITTAAAHLDRTMRDLLDLSTAEDVGIEAKHNDVDLQSLITDVAAVARGTARNKHIQLACDVRVPRMVGDRDLLRRLLQNLIHNAIKHAPTRSTVTIETVPDDDGGVLLRVLDAGRGVPPADVERIFDRYVSTGSYGLGLAFCRLVAETHGGRIWVEPRQPTGATFCVRIPALAVAEEPRRIFS